MQSKWLPWSKNLVDPELVEKVLEVYPARKYEKGQSIFQQGDISNNYYLLLEGRVEIIINNYEGKKKIMNIHEPKCFFGEIIFDCEPRPTSAICLTNVTLAILDTTFQLGTEYYEKELYKTLFLLNNYKMRTHIRQISEQVFDDVEDRIEKLLLGLCSNFGEEKPDYFQVNLPVTQQLIADVVGCSRVRVSQILCDISKKNKILIERNKLIFYKK